MEGGLKNSQLMNVFKCFDRGNKGHIDVNDLRCIFKDSFGTEYKDEELNFALDHLKSMGTIDDKLCTELDFHSFVEAVNNTIKTKSLESILKGVFDNLTKGTNEITVDELLKLAENLGMDVGDDARIRLNTRLPKGNANFKEFLNCIVNT